MKSRDVLPKNVPGVGWGGVCHTGVGWGVSCRGGVVHTGVGWAMSYRVGWVIQGWGRVCYAGVGWVTGEVGHAGVGWVIQGWGGVCHTEVGSYIQSTITICTLYHVVIAWNYWGSQIQLQPHT